MTAEANRTTQVPGRVSRSAVNRPARVASGVGALTQIPPELAAVYTGGSMGFNFADAACNFPGGRGLYGEDAMET